MVDSTKGYQITSAFKYIQKVCKECKQIIARVDNEMASEYHRSSNNSITKDLSTSLALPEKWILSRLYRVYEARNEELNNEFIRKVITITFFGNDLKEPIIIAGKITYSNKESIDDWDLYNIWFNWSESDGKNNYILDGAINTFESKEKKHIQKAKLFSVPLIDIQNASTLVEKVTNPLKDL